VLKNINILFNIFYRNNFELYLVGGAVRDLIRNATPKDYDFATSASPKEMLNTFKNAIPTGIKYGTVTILINNEAFEVTTYRIEKGYIDSRHPEQIYFSKDLLDDLKRRDFTINAIAMSYNDLIIDPYNGKKDINLKIIKTTQDPFISFNDDILRILRAIRFASVLEFTIEENTFNAMKNLANKIKYISKERIQIEFFKSMVNPLKTFYLLLETGLLNILFDDLFNDININLTINLLKQSEKKDINFNLTLFFYYTDYNKLKKIFQELRFPNKIVIYIFTVFNNINITDKENIYDYIPLLANSNEIIYDIIDIFKCIRKSENNYDKIFINKLKENILILKRNYPLSIKDLYIDGNILKNKFNLKNKEIGDCLKFIFSTVIKNPKQNNKKDIINIIKEYINEKNNK